MSLWVGGLVVTGEVVCDGCGRTMKHPERYAYVSEEEQPPQRLCEKCSRVRGYLRQKKDEKGREVETFL